MSKSNLWLINYVLPSDILRLLRQVIASRNILESDADPSHPLNT